MCIITDFFIIAISRIFDGVWDCTMQTETDTKSSELILSVETSCWG